MTVTFNGLLETCGLRPQDVSVILHTPKPRKLHRVLPWLASERPDLFDAYQSVHSTNAESTLRNRPFAAAFVSDGKGGMCFVGLYDVAAAEYLPTSEIYADPRFAELEELYGATDTAPSVNIERTDRQIRFDLRQTEFLADMRGRLWIAAPGGRAYVRIAANLDAPIMRITDEAGGYTTPPEWREFCVSGTEVRALPIRWAERLSEWRGVYLIVDESDGARYVGAAYGADNLFGRWRDHVAGARGITRELSKRDPENFRFSILERVSPDMPADEAIALEHTWMDRLHTRRYGLNA